MYDDLIYLLGFILTGLLSLQWHRNSETDHKDPYLIKTSFLIYSVLAFILAGFLVLKLLFNDY